MGNKLEVDKQHSAGWVMQRVSDSETVITDKVASYLDTFVLSEL